MENLVKNLDFRYYYGSGLIHKKLDPDYARKSIISIIGTKREYLDYISQHIELLEWAYDEKNSTKNFDSYLAVYELKEVILSLI